MNDDIHLRMAQLRPDELRRDSQQHRMVAEVLNARRPTAGRRRPFTGWRALTARRPVR